ncbi:MAG: T9SS type A sorting domain-containing protein [Candidatus Eisenbacteria bacterium]|nr:T9SS type A sorting domain-containing protein [Candidatus Eisenbacteria bacterium]
MRRGSGTGLAPLVLVGIAALVASAEGGVLTGIGAIPDPFSPNVDGVYDSTAVHYTLSETAAVIVSVADSSLVELATLWAGWEGAGDRRHWWNGRVGGAVAGDGRYAFVVTAVPQGGGLEQAVAPLRLDTDPPVVLQLEALPARFSPDADGVADTLTVSGSAAFAHASDRVRVRALTPSGSVVRSILPPSGSGSFRARWDGRSDSGVVSPDGLYVIEAEAWDLAGNSSEATVLIDLDIAPPRLGARFPQPGAAEFRVADTLAVVTGWAYDRAGVRAVQVSLDGVAWTGVGASGADTVDWSHALVCGACVPGVADESVSLRVRAYDGAATADGLGHVNTTTSANPILSVPVVFDVAGPIHTSSTVQAPGPRFTPGQMITISTRWDSRGYTIAADFSRVDSEFLPGLVQVIDSGGGTYLVKYVTSDANALLPVTNARVIITATDAFQRSVPDSSVTVSVATGSSEVEAFELDRNAFDPSAGESVTIGLGGGSGISRVAVYNAAGALVRSIEASGASSIAWDGRGDDGEALSSGVYFVRIRSGGNEAVRKVAVVKR